MASLQTAYGPSRIREPLKRVGNRGKGDWKPVSWEEAIAEFADQIQKLRAAQQSHTIACITNNSDGTTNELLERFLRAVGSRNFLKMNSGKDARTILLKLMQGIDGHPAYDFEHTRLILSFGSSIFEGWGTCGRMYGDLNAWFHSDQGPAELIQVESNFSTTASQASRWVPIAPGTETALALGIAHVMLSEGSYDKSFVDKYCFGFEDWEGRDGRKHPGFKSEVLADYSPPSVEKITGISVKDIETVAHKFAATQPSLAVGGGGRGQHFSGIYELMAVHSLNALVGNINRPGGVLVKLPVPLTPLPDVEMDEEAKRGYSCGRLDGAGASEFPFSASLPGRLNASDIKLLLVHEANPLYSMPEQQAAEQLFNRVPYIVSLSAYMDESSERADLILPLSTRFERWDDQLPAPELQYALYNLNQPVVKPIYQTKSAGDILVEAAKQIGGTVAGSFPWASMEDVLKERTRGLYESGRGIIDSTDLNLISEKTVSDIPSYVSFSSMWAKLQEKSSWFDPRYEYGDPRKVLKTPSGKFEFFSQALESKLKLPEEKCMPYYEQPNERPKDFSLMIMTEDTLLMGDDGKGTSPFIIKQLDETVLKNDELFVQINPITAMYHNLKEGDQIILESPAAKAHVRLHLYEGVREGVVLIPLGFGHTAFDQFQKNKGVNAKRLVVAMKDSITGLPLWRTTPARITKA
jgi:anaerobic selenocysteine-containing dehydrogenase